MPSNSKHNPPGKEAPTEPFKRAVTGCLRAIARHPELEVSFAAERPGMVGGKAALPEPARKLTRADAAVVRGHADSIALRMACHDPSVHRRLVPGGQQARAVFEAVEQARVEAIGARRMQGVAQNLSAMLDDKFHRGKFDEITDRADAPIEEAVAMMVRERLTGLAPPAAAKKLVDLWRPWIEGRAGRALDKLEKLVENQRGYGDAVHDLLDSLDMGDERSREDDEEDSEDSQNEEGRKDDDGKDGEASDSDELQRQSLEEAEASTDELPEDASEAMDAPSAEMPDDSEMGDADNAAEPWRPRHRGDAAARQFRLDARPADHGGGDLRRHPGAHAGALRREGRDPRLHDARLEGWAVARSLARRRQAAQSGPAQRSAPHHLQVGGRALAARAHGFGPDDARGPAQGEYRRRGARLGAQAPAGADRAAQDPDDDLGRRAGRRLHALGQCRKLSQAPLVLGDRGHRDALPGRADRDRHRSRRHALLPARRHHRGRRGAGRRDDRQARRIVRRERAGRAAP